MRDEEYGEIATPYSLHPTTDESEGRMIFIVILRIAKQKITEYLSRG